MTRSLLKLSVWALLVVLLAIAAAGVGFYNILAAQQAAFQGRQNQLVAQHIAAELGRFVEAQRSILAELARQPSVLAAMESERHSDRARKGEELRALFAPHANLQLISAQQDLAGPSGLGAYCNALLQRLRAGKESFLIDHHRNDDAKSHVDFAQAVRRPDDQHFLGSAILSTAFTDIQSLVAAHVVAGRHIALRQHGTGTEPQTIAVWGEAADAASDPALLRVGTTPWELVVSEHPSGSLLATPGQRWVAILLLALLFGAMVFLAAVLWRINHAARHDVRSLVRMFQDIRQGAVRVDYPMELSEFNTVFAYLRDSGKQLVQQQQHFRDMGLIDHLSQLNNRRAFEQRLSELFKQNVTHSTSSVLMIDLDHFKQVNDQRGHDIGDALIVSFSQALKKLVRASDFLARLGGDEFCVIFAYTPLKQAGRLALRLRQELPRAFMLPGGYEHSVRWTGGLSAIDTKDTKFEQVLHRADQALLRAKETGRNQTYFVDPDTGVQAALR